MLSSAKKKYELVISSVVTVVFLLFSIFGINIYTSELNRLTVPSPKVYADTPDIQGAYDETVAVVSPTIPDSIKAKQPPTPTITPKSADTKPTVIPVEEKDQSSNPTHTPMPTHSVQNSEPANNTSAILTALNEYRQKNGSEPLSIDSTLQTFAQSRADFFASTGSMDNHSGFQSMLNDNGFEKMGFNALGENSSFGEWGSPQNLIESIYGSSSAHNESQLRGDWTHVGIGLKGTATNLVFGGKKR